MSEEQKHKLEVWMKGLVAAIVAGGANAAIGIFGATTLSPQTFNGGSEWNIWLTLKLAGALFASGAIGGALLYLKDSPVPKD